LPSKEKSLSIRLLKPAEPDQHRPESRFVGRERELAEIRAAIQDASSGRGRMLLLSGEPGIGKTCLADQAASYAASRGMRVAWGRCWEGGGAPPFWPWVQVLRVLIGDRDRSLPPIPEQIARLIPQPGFEGVTNEAERHYPEYARFLLFDSVATMLKELARDRALMIVLDDLHESDQPSLLMLRFLSRELALAPILLLGTCREAEVSASPWLQQLIGELVHEGHQLPLRGLSKAEVSQLVEIYAGSPADPKLVAGLHHATNGNPLFVEGVARMLAAEGQPADSAHGSIDFALTDTVREAIRRRIDALPKSTQAILSISSVLGNEFELRPLSHIAKLPEEAVAEELAVASRAGIAVAVSRERYRFAHALIRGEVYAAIGAAKRTQMHRETANVIEKLYQDNPESHLAELAHHFREGRVADKAIEYSYRAGQAAERVLAYEEAISQYEAGLELTGNDGTPMRGQLLARLANNRMFTGIGWERGIQQAEEAIELFEKLGFLNEVARAHADLGLQLSKDDDENHTDIPRANVHFARSELTLSQGPEGEPLAWLYLGMAVASWKALDIPRGLDVCKRGLPIGVRVYPAEAISFRLLRSHMLSYLGRFAEALTVEAVSAEPPPDLIARGRLAQIRGEIRRLLWDPGEAAKWLANGFADPERLEKVPSVRHALAERLAIVNLMTGDLAEAGKLSAVGPSSSLSGLISMYTGDWQAADKHLRQSLSIARRSGSRVRESDTTLWFAQLLRIEGAFAQARALLEEGLRAFGDGSLPLVEMWLRPEFVLLLVENGDIAVAESQLARCSEIIAAGEDWRGLVGHVARAKAVVAAAQGKLQEAESQFETAVRIFQRYSLPWEEAEALYYWGRALIAANLNSRGGEKLAAAIEIYRRHQASQRWIDRIEAARKEAAVSGLTDAESVLSGQASFRQEGEYWTLAYKSGTFRLKDSKGLQYIAFLIRNAMHELRADEVASVGAGAVSNHLRNRAPRDAVRVASDLGDTGVILDARAKAEYRARMTELKAEMAEAEGNNDVGRVEKLRFEIDALERQLASALGLGGRDRKSRSHMERARWMVTNGIKRAISKIRACDPALARHLSTCIRTGNFCSYTPDSDHPLVWRL
jgi:tetratricopeptide (TPR) repeat protein